MALKRWLFSHAVNRAYHAWVFDSLLKIIQQNVDTAPSERRCDRRAKSTCCAGDERDFSREGFHIFSCQRTKIG